MLSARFLKNVAIHTILSIRKLLDCYCTFSHMKTLRVFEAFAGIGAQYSALKNLANRNPEYKFKVVGISEWFINALLAYKNIHYPNQLVKDIPIDRDELLDKLKPFTFSWDSVHPYNIAKLKTDKLQQLYVANKLSKNLGSISEISLCQMKEKVDLLIYSFPCQDLSTGGKTQGMTQGSGTRSSLIWEIKRILLDLQKKNRLPTYLLMENVRAIFSDKNRKDLNLWKSFLESMGYKQSQDMILDARCFGIPQDRQRAFILSTRKANPIDVSSLLVKTPEDCPSVADFLHYNYIEKQEPYLSEANEAQLNRTPSREEMWDINELVSWDKKQKKSRYTRDYAYTITCNMDRSNTSGLLQYKGSHGDSYRRLTIREAFRLMGFTDADYENTKKLGLSYRQMNKLIGNSIVVNVLEAIFKLIFEDFNDGK